jgi:hypothetical protein
MNGGEQKYVQGFGGETCGEKDYLQNLGVNGRIILKRVFKKCNGSLYWIDLAQDRD